MTETATLSQEERGRILNLKVQELAARKWQLQSASETTATMVTPRASYMLAHMILCVLTIGFWFFVAVPLELVRRLIYGWGSHYLLKLAVDERGVLSATEELARL